MLAGVFQCSLHTLLSAMTKEIHKEIILPLPPPAGPGFYIRQVNAVLLEDIQHVRQGPCFMRRAEQYRCLVVAGGLGILSPDYEETRHVVGHVLDILADNVQAVQFRRTLRSDSRGFRLLGRHLSRTRRRGNGNSLRILERRTEPASALGEYLGLGINLLDLLQRT